MKIQAIAKTPKGKQALSTLPTGIKMMKYITIPGMGEIRKAIKGLKVEVIKDEPYTLELTSPQGRTFKKKILELIARQTSMSGAVKKDYEVLTLE